MGLRRFAPGKSGLNNAAAGSWLVGQDDFKRARRFKINQGCRRFAQRAQCLPRSRRRRRRNDFAEAAPEFDGGRGELKVDGQVVATGKQANSIAFQQVADETFDVGVDTRTGVNDEDYQAPFPLNGTINKLTFTLGPSQLTAEDQKAAATAIAITKD
jgi:hypothetical protein